MARVVAPLFSQEASGTVGKSLVYSRRRGQNVVRGYTIPSNPNTAAQITARDRIRVTGQLTRRINATQWQYAAVLQTWIEYYRGRLPVGNVWNSVLPSEMIGPAAANFIARVTQYGALASGVTDLWQAAGVEAIAGLADITSGDVTYTAGFSLFLAESTVANAGYGPTFDPTTPIAIIDGS